MDNKDPYNSLTWDSILKDCKTQKGISFETEGEPKPLKPAVSDAMKLLLKTRLRFINTDDAINLYRWCPAEEIIRIWQECGSPAVKSVGQMTHAEAWTMQQKCWGEEQKCKNPSCYNGGDIWLLNDLDKKYFSWCSGIWNAMSYSQRLKWMGNVRSKRLRGVTPHLMLKDISDQYGSWKNDRPSVDDGAYNEEIIGNNSPFL